MAQPRDAANIGTWTYGGSPRSGVDHDTADAALASFSGAPASDSTTTIPASGMSFDPDAVDTPAPKYVDSSAADNALASFLLPPPASEKAFTSTPEEEAKVPRRTVMGAPLNEEYEKYPDLFSMPELLNPHPLSNPRAIPVLYGTATTGAAGTKNVLENWFPETEPRLVDGYVLAKSKKDGKIYKFGPGGRLSDFGRGIIGGLEQAAGASLLPAALSGPGIVGAMGKGAAGNLVTDAISSASGAGPVDPYAIPKGAAFGALTHAGLETSRLAANTILGNAPAAEASTALAAQPLPGEPPVTDLTSTTHLYTQAARGDQAAKQEFARRLGYNQEVVDSAIRTGTLDSLLPEHLGTDPTAKAVMQATRSVPASVSAAVQETGLRKVGNRMRDLLEEWGGDLNRAAESSNVQARTQAIIDEGKALAKSQYTAVDNLVPADTPVQGPAVQEVLDYIAKVEKGLGKDAQDMSPILKDMKRVLTPKEPPKTTLADAKLAETYGGTPPSTEAVPPTYAAVDALTRKIGKGARPNTPFAEETKGMFKDAYAMMSKIRRDAAESAHPGAGALLDEAQKTVVLRKEFESKIKDAFGAQNAGVLGGELGPQADAAMKPLAKQELEKFNKFVDALPKEMREGVVTSSLAEALGKYTMDRPVDFHKFVGWYEGLRGAGENPSQAFNKLVANLTPSARAGIKDIYNVAKAITSATKYNIQTGRLGYVMGTAPKAESFLSELLDVASHVGGGIGGAARWANLVRAKLEGATTPLMEAADAFIVSPEFQPLMKAMSGKAPVPQAVIRQTLSSRGFQRLANALKVPKPQWASLLESGGIAAALGSPAWGTGPEATEEGPATAGAVGFSMARAFLRANLANMTGRVPFAEGDK